MSEELNTEITNLKNQNQQLLATVNLRVAEVESTKEMMGEVVQGQLNLRTNFKLVVKQAQELNAKVEELKKQISSLDQQLTDATAKIADLTEKNGVLEATIAGVSQAA